MRKHTLTFENAWSLWLCSCSAFILSIGASLALWIQTNVNNSGEFHTAARNFLLENLRAYNNITHGIFIIILLILTTWTCWAIRASDEEKPKPEDSHWAYRTARAIKQHPATTIVLTIYAALMINESSWFYKEILTWYDDVNAGYLLNNFSIKDAFISETMWRNDYRFFPLSHQDLHILSWFTPYTKVWSMISAFELIITIIFGCKIIKLVNKNQSSPSLYLMGSLLFIFTSASAFNYFQFIYSERVLTMLTAIYFYHYCIYQQTKNVKNGRLSIIFALFIPFFKDTAILLVAIPAMTTLILGSFGQAKNYPRWHSGQFQKWRNAYSTEIAICSIILFFLACFTILSFLPSAAAGVPRYDSHLEFSVLALDIRLIILIGFIATRIWLICQNRSNVTALDGMNCAALGYGFALFGLVGLDASNYMTLPIQFVAVLDILMIWEVLAAPRLNKKLNSRQAQAIALGATFLLLNIEDRQAKTFRNRTTEITQKQRSWQQTLKTADAFASKAKEDGEVVNLIYTKGWFKSSDQMQTLAYDRLIYYDIDSREYKIIDGINKGASYKPQQGDFLIDIDSGKRTFSHGINQSDYEIIYQQDPSLKYARIYRHR